MGLAERGVRRPPGWMGEEAFLRIAMRFLPGRQPRRAVARAVQWPIETVRTYRQTRILRFMSAPTSPAARLTNYYGGTSFAAPMWAGYLALVNQQSVANGNKTAGFINPSLYGIGGGSSYSSSFHDIN